MAKTLFLSLKTVNSLLYRNVLKLPNLPALPPARHLYARGTLGLESFTQQQQQVRNQMGNVIEKFKEKMNAFCIDDSKNMIFTEDLKNMVHIAQNDEDIDLVVKMMKGFNQQNKQVRFGSFVFGPVVMRLFHIHNKADLALECFQSPEMRGFFDQLITYQILLDLLYESGKYKEVLDAFETIQERQIEGTKYPKNVVVLAMAACYKLNSKESLKYALNAWQKMTEVGHFPMRRAATFCAGLALNQGDPGAAMEIISSVRNANYTTVRNIKVAALVDIGRVEDAIPILKSILNKDEASDNLHTFNRDVFEKVKAAVGSLDDPELSLEFNRLEQLFQKQGHISENTLDSQLCSDIAMPPMMNNRQYNQFNNQQNQSYNNRQNVNRFQNRSDRFENRSDRFQNQGFYRRPGLTDMD